MRWVVFGTTTTNSKSVEGVNAMYTKQPKKLIIMNILDILKKYTDENHRLSQKEIRDLLEREYDMKVARKAVKRNLMDLIEFGYYINYSESVRMIKDKNGEEQETVILTDFHIKRDFTNNSDIDWSKSFSEIDRQLYSKYELSPEEIDFIESKVAPME